MKILTFLGLMGAACTATSGATAETRVSHHQRSAAVYVADLSLDTVVDAQVLYERISYAARTLCTADELSFDAKRRMHRRQCVDTAVESAVERANAPLLTAIHLRQRAQLARL